MSASVSVSVSVCMFTRRRWATPFVIASLALGLLAHDVLAASSFATPAFQQRWSQDEGLIRNFWGPLALATNGQPEAYVYDNSCVPIPQDATSYYCLPAPNTLQRTVQYFDKGRMEANPLPGKSQVTSGLLVREMISGNMQTGDRTSVQRQPAAIAIAGDLDNTFPKYSDLTTARVPMILPAGAPVSTQLNADGSASAVAPAAVPDAASAISTTDTVTQVAVPRVFDDFRARIGVDVIGYAISGPFYVSVRIGGVQRRVLMQAFERRVLTYNAANPPEFQVEFGNVGRHYYRWRYGVDPS